MEESCWESKYIQNTFKIHYILINTFLFCGLMRVCRQINIEEMNITGIVHFMFNSQINKTWNIAMIFN